MVTVVAYIDAHKWIRRVYVFFTTGTFHILLNKQQVPWIKRFLIYPNKYFSISIFYTKSEVRGLQQVFSIKLFPNRNSIWEGNVSILSWLWSFNFLFTCESQKYFGCSKFFTSPILWWSSTISSIWPLDMPTSLPTL